MKQRYSFGQSRNTLKQELQNTEGGSDQHKLLS